MVWYTDSSSINMVRVLQEIPKILGLKRAESAYRTFRIIEGPDDEDWEQEDLGADIPASALPDLYKPGTALHVDDDFAEAGEQIKRAIVEGIDEVVCGKHPPSRAFIDIGRHYFIDDPDETDTVVQYTALVGFWGYSTPNDYEEMRKLVFQLPAVRELGAELEGVLNTTRGRERVQMRRELEGVDEYGRSSD